MKSSPGVGVKERGARKGGRERERGRESGG